MSRINVLHVVGSLGVGGREKYLLEMLKNTDSAKVNFLYLCWRNTEDSIEAEFIENGGRVVYVPKKSWLNPGKNIYDIKRIIVDNNIDIVHSHINFASFYSLMAAKKAGVQVRISHSHTNKMPYDKGLKHVYMHYIMGVLMRHYSTYNLACGQDAGRFLFGDDKFEVANNGIDIERYYYNSVNRREIRESYVIDNDAVVLGTVARLDFVKNQKFLIRVFDEYRSINPNSKLIIVGDGPERTILEHLSRKLGIWDEVIFTGMQNETHRFYSAFDVFLLPSFNEGLPLTIVEAQSNGLTCIASTGVTEEANLTKNVKYYPLSSGPRYWAQQISDLDLKRKNVKKVMMSSPYNVKVSAKEMIDLYEKLISEHEK